MDKNNFLITHEDESQRLDKFLAEKFEAKSRSYFQYLIDKGSVLVNKQKVKKRFVCKAGDEIDIFFQALPDITLKAENIPLDILYEDEHIIAINKPANMVVHPASGNWSKTFVNALLYHLKNKIEIDDQIRPGIVHRLDKDTTGVLLAAKTIKAHQNLIEQFKLRQINKKYLAITINKPENQIINAPIARHPIKRKEMSIIDGGKEAITEIEVIKYNDKFSYILATPKTGRTHQIRVHLKHINCPILGDPIYGSKNVNNKFNFSTQLLHAYLIELTHPITNKKIKIQAPPPLNLKKFIEQI
ncbi:MAG: Ribosomal large subunit pseudouridine synthase D [Candidatus Anoxychlamydiales bacterium]|nr:Ribosomal large subunit pseudouridine synthase D [Candidatus Anoxychlamydiales bacterium]NGX36459.1 Ribosomal large subunit pseudouridine synthase D [Candidatus Anoxychlamydiales bacterium]